MIVKGPEAQLRNITGYQIWALRDDLVAVVTDTILEISRRFLCECGHGDRFRLHALGLCRIILDIKEA